MVALDRLRTFLRTEAEATGLPLKALLTVATAVHVAVAVLAVNPWHPDEHFQILEFAWARAGLAPVSDLPWEWGSRIRPTLQPALALGLLRGLRLVGVESPFVWMFLLRLGTLALALTVLLRVIAHVSPELTRTGRRALWLSGLFLWFFPLLLFRFTSENLGGLALAAALTTLPTGAKGVGGTQHRPWITALLLGLAVVFRLQMAFAVAAVLAWVWAYRPRGLRTALGLAAGAAAVVVAASAVDGWFYGGWVFAPWNYVRANLLEGVATSFGTEPPWWYVAWTPVWMAPPLGPILAALVVAGVIRRRKSPWSWALVAFFLGHSAVAHKELRFLFPLAYLLPVLVAWGAEALEEGTRGVGLHAWPGWLRGVGGVLAVQNVLLLALLLTPALHRGKEVDAHYLRALWARGEAASGDTVYVLAEDGDPYLVWGSPANVYRHPRVRGVRHEPGAPVPSHVPAGMKAGRLLLVTRAWASHPVAGAETGDTVYRAEPGYRTVARWLGQSDARWLRRLEVADGWRGPSRARTVVEVRPATQATPTGMP